MDAVYDDVNAVSNSGNIAKAKEFMNCLYNSVNCAQAVESNEISMCSTCLWPVVRASYHCPFYIVVTLFLFFFLDLLLMFKHCRLNRHDHATSDKAGNSCFLPLYLKIAFLPIASIRTKNLTHLLFFTHTVQAFIPFDHSEHLGQAN